MITTQASKEELKKIRNSIPFIEFRKWPQVGIDINIVRCVHVWQRHEAAETHTHVSAYKGIFERLGAVEYFAYGIHFDFSSIRFLAGEGYRNNFKWFKASRDYYDGIEILELELPFLRMNRIDFDSFHQPIIL